MDENNSKDPHNNQKENEDERENPTQSNPKQSALSLTGIQISVWEGKPNTEQSQAVCPVPDWNSNIQTLEKDGYWMATRWLSTIRRWYVRDKSLPPQPSHEQTRHSTCQQNGRWSLLRRRSLQELITPEKTVDHSLSPPKKTTHITKSQHEQYN